MSSQPPTEFPDDKKNKEFERRFDAATSGAGGGDLTKPPSPPPLLPFSDPRVALALDTVFKLGNNLNQLWMFLLVISGAVAGWTFSSSGTLDRGQQLIATILYVTFLLVNGSAMFRMYKWLNVAMTDLRKVASLLDEQSQELRDAMSNVKIPGGGWLPPIVYITIVVAVLASIWYPQVKVSMGF